MGERAEELLYLLFWTTDMFCRPTVRNCTETFEAWAHRNGYLDDIHRLERRYLLRKRKKQARRKEVRPSVLTPNGRLRALGGRDPEARWSRPWDGRWRLVAFDFPQSRDSGRRQLRRVLRSHDFGCFQKSVWITPDPIDWLLPKLRKLESNVSRLTVLEAFTLGANPASAVVASSWDFEQINLAYRRCLELLGQVPEAAAADPPNNQADELRSWLGREQAAWLQAVSIDPLLPAALLPPDYLGRSVWLERARVLREAVPRVLL